jgi:hypothetical protein
MSLNYSLSQSLSSALSLLATVYLLACEGRPHPVASALPTASPHANATQTTHADELLRQYMQLAASTNPTDHKPLLEALSSSEFLFRLDSRDDYRRKATADLRLARLYEAMRKNDSAAMRATWLTLARTNQPGACDACDELLIKTLSVIRPAPPEVIEFWAKHSAPESIQLGFTIDALCENGSIPALALLEKRLTATPYPPEQKISWMRRAMLPHRRDVAMLAAVDRLLNRALPKSLRPALVEVMFDYRPDEWYRERHPPTPDAQPLTPEAKTLLQKIGAMALKKVTLTATQRRAVTKALNELKP